MQESIASIVHRALDFCLETLAKSPDTFGPPKDAQSIKTNLTRAEVQQVQAQKETGHPFSSYPGDGPWAVALWNDEKHSFSDVIDQVCRAVPQCTKKAALECAMRVDAYVCCPLLRPVASRLILLQGRDIIMVTRDVEQAYSAARLMAAIDLGVTVQTAEFMSDEHVCGQIIDWLNDLADSSAAGDSFLFRRIIGRSLFGVPTAVFPTTTLSRLSRLLAFDAKLWKRARLHLRELFVRIAGLGGYYREQLCMFSSIAHYLS